MGTIVAVLVDCSNCGQEIRVQANSIEGSARYRLDEKIPKPVMYDVDGETVYCTNCDNRHVLEVKERPTLTKRSSEEATRIG